MKAINIVGVIKTTSDLQIARNDWLRVANTGIWLLSLAIKLTPYSGSFLMP